MADAGNDSRALVPARPCAYAVAPPRTRSQKWEVEYARYFGTPRRDPSAPPPPGLRHITRGVQRHQGTWLPASSPAALCITRPTLPSAVPVLTVSIGDVVFVRTEPHSLHPFLVNTQVVCFSRVMGRSFRCLLFLGEFGLGRSCPGLGLSFFFGLKNGLVLRVNFVLEHITVDVDFSALLDPC